MATDYTLDGTTASFAPYSQKWVRFLVGRAFDQAPIYAGSVDVEMRFDSCSITDARFWLDAASSGSHNITVLAPWGIHWTDLSGVHLEVTDFPTVEAAAARGFVIIIKGASVNSG